ncbi:MAG: T9SS type A sorting domain-containing protein [Bacteroidia bacterium]|nr:T9SS type A sorting domain-containing protein [Bacteroidia bacterium]
MNLKHLKNLILIACLSNGIATAQLIPVTFGSYSKVPEDFFGYNGANFVRANEPNYNTLWVVDSLPSLHANTIRYTAGLPGNYWDWQTGTFLKELPPNWILPKDYDGINPKKSDLITFRAMVNRAIITPMLSCNILCSNKEFQLAELFYAKGINIPIKYIEMGSELYHTRLNYVEVFPTPTDYALRANEWASYFKSFPFFANIKIGVVGATQRPEESYSRRNTWTTDVAATVNSDVDAIILHYYNSGSWAANPVNIENLHLMLSAPFKQFDNEAKMLNTIRNAGKESWLTEYNHYDRSRCTHDTWAHGLFVASQTLCFFEDTNITKVLCHALTGDGRLGALFNDSSALRDYEKYRGDVDCSLNAPYTIPHEKSAAGTALAQVAHAIQNSTNKRKLLFGNGSRTFTTGHSTLYGWQFDNNNFTEAIIMNLDSIRQDITFDTAQWNLNGSLYQQIFPGPGGPLDFIIGNAKYKPDSNELKIILDRQSSQRLSLPAYSLTRIWVSKNKIYLKAADTLLCNGTFTQIQAYGGKKYTWSGAKFDYLTPDSSLVKFTNGNNKNQVYTVIATDQNGVTASINITVTETPSLTVSTNKNVVCAGNEAKLTATLSTSNPNAVFHYVWVPSQTIVNPNLSICKVYPTKTTTYTVYATDGKCFAPYDSVTIKVAPYAEAPKDTIITLGSSIMLKPLSTQTNVTFNWYEGSNFLGTDSALITPNQTTVYTLIGNNLGSCTDTDYVTVQVVEVCNSATDTALTFKPYTTIKEFALKMIDYCTVTGACIATDTLLKNFTGEIVFNGPLILNDNFSFSNCTNLKFGEGAYIEHNKDNRLLEFINCQLSAAACNNKMWDGIKMLEPGEKLTLRNTTIADATVGINSFNNAVVVLDSCTFLNCYIGVDFERYDESEAEGKVSATKFLGNTLTLEPYAGKTSFAGILCDNASVLNFGDSKEQPNIFSGSLFGIYSINTSLELHNNIFENLVTDTTLGQPYTGTGVYMTNTNASGNIADPVQLWPLHKFWGGNLGLNNGNTFKNMRYGIITENIETNVTNNEFDNVAFGIKASKGVIKLQTINKNQFINTAQAIELNDNKKAVISITNNTIHTQFATSANDLIFGVRIIESAGNSSQLRIADNLIENNGLSGIEISNNYGGIIENNQIIQNSLQTETSIALSVENSDSVTISCNKVSSTDSLTIAPTQTAYKFAFAPESQVLCNSSNGTAIGFQFLANCDLSDIRNNKIKAHDNGLVLGDVSLTGGVIGPQPGLNQTRGAGNIFEGAYTVSTGTGAAKGFFTHAATLSVNSQAAGVQGTNTQFMVYNADSLQVPYPNLSIGSNATPFTPVLKNKPSNPCPTVCAIPLKINNGETNFSNAYDYAAAVLLSNNNEDATTHARKVFVLKAQNQVSTSNPSLASFTQQYKITNLGNMALVSDYYKTMKANDKDVYQKIATVLNTMQPNNIVELNWHTLELIKTENAIEQKPLSQIQYQIIKNIANQCPYIGGKSVFDARGIVAGIEHVVYNDATTCQTKPIVKNTHVNTLPFINAYPNPANQYFNVVYNLSDYKNANIHFFDIAGRLVLANDINTTQGFQAIDVSMLEAGIYAYVAIADGQKILQGKVCVISK